MSYNYYYHFSYIFYIFSPCKIFEFHPPSCSTHLPVSFTPKVMSLITFLTDFNGLDPWSGCCQGNTRFLLATLPLLLTISRAMLCIQNRSALPFRQPSE